MMVTCVDGQMYCNFHGVVQCYGQMLHIAVMLRSNVLHLATSSQTALILHEAIHDSVTLQFYITCMYHHIGAALIFPKFCVSLCN